MLNFVTSWEFITGAIAGAVFGALFTRKNKDGVNAFVYVWRFTCRNFKNFFNTEKEKGTDGNL